MKATAEKEYVQLSELEHVLHRPGMYIGDYLEKEEAGYVFKNDKFEFVDSFKYNPAILKLFDEILSNSIDESKRNKKLTWVKVHIEKDSGEISVWDNGGIDTSIHKKYGKPIPQMIFSELRTGSNFDDSEARTATGTHGLGAKLTNIFSTEFKVKTSDGKKVYQQTFKNNNKDASEPKYKDADSKDGWTEIKFTIDFKRLNAKLDNGNYERLVKRVLDAAACNENIDFSLNGSKIKIRNFKDYIKLYTEEFIYDEADGIQVGFAPSEGSFQHVSFANSTETKVGGQHIDAVMNPVVDAIRAYLKKKHKVDIKPGEIRSHFLLFVNATVVNPRYSSQTKENLIGGTLPAWTPPDKVIKKIIDSEIIQSILDAIKAKEEARRLAELRKLGKEVDKSSVRKILELSDATGTDRSKSILFLTEGKSAALTIKSARDPKTMGSYPLRGKPLNVFDIDTAKLLANNEFKEILVAVGLTIGRKVTSVSELRYGKIAFATDADVDGSHITGLLINMFYTFWPELFDLGVICRFRTPVLKAFLKDKTLSFFSLKEFRTWEEKNKDTKYKARYYKGLGTSTAADFREYFKNIDDHLIVLNIKNEKDKDAIMLAFDKGRADDRKVWLGIGDK